MTDNSHREPARARRSTVKRVKEAVDPHRLAAWVDPYRDKRGLRAFGVRQLEIAVQTARRLRSDEISQRAAALTYYSLVSLVPLLAVGFALFKAFGGLESVEAPLKRLIVESIAAGRSQQVATWIDQFIANINAGAIAGFGVVMLFYSAVGLLTNIESSFNKIWSVARGRSLYMRFAIYWCLVTLAPPLVGLSISISAQLQSSSFAAAVLGWLPFGLGRLIVSLGSVVAIALTLVVTFIIVPNTKVQLRCALIGGTVSAVLWSLVKVLFISMTAGSVKYDAVYGALSTLPLLILWLYVSWNIVLFGVLYTNAYQTMVGARIEHEPAMSSLFRDRLAARLMVEVARRFVVGDRAPTAEELALAAGASGATIGKVLAQLVAVGQLAEARIDDEQNQTGYLPARDLTSTTLADTVEALRQAGDAEPHALVDDQVQRELDALLERAREAGRAALGARSLRELGTAPRDEGQQGGAPARRAASAPGS